ncbi:MAG TPA: MmgE/PrpD family protein [Acidobacteriaceae bacterium]|nr:MmgE/PrpD family protein [Acidobacteriaceae bacterium]
MAKAVAVAGVENPSAILADFLAQIRFEDLPAAVVARTEEAFVDWWACALAGRGARPVRILEAFASGMGPVDGPSQILTSRSGTSAFFAALTNGAASHIVEQDDVHNGAMFHPGTTVFPAVLAAAEAAGVSGKTFIAGAVAGYEAAIRTGEFLGPDHYKVFHTTGTAGKVGAAAGVANILGLNARQTLDALGSAGTQAAGLWEFLRDAADSKVLHSAKAAADGVLSAWLARDGFTGASHILEGKQGMAAGLSHGPSFPARLSEGLGTRWTILECTYKPYACCRHTHPSADALRLVMKEHGIAADEIAHVTAHVHQGAVDVLGRVKQPETPYQARFSLGFVLALAAYKGRAGVSDFTEETLHDPQLRAFHDGVEMVLDPAIPRNARTRRGRVEVRTRDGSIFVGRVNAAKGDPDNSLNREELESKAQELAAYSGAATAEEVHRVVAQAWRLHEAPDLRGLQLPRS